MNFFNKDQLISYKYNLLSLRKKYLTNFKECLIIRNRYFIVTFAAIICIFFSWMRYDYFYSKNTYVIHEELEIEQYREEWSYNLTSILIWTQPNHDPLDKLLEGQKAFIKRKCKYKNCLIIRDKLYFENVTDFDVILFNGPELLTVKEPDLPKHRSPHQKYVYSCIESSDYYPVCDKRFDGYFNLTWTYKFNSDISFKYIVVRNDKGDVIGPKEDMHWLSLDDMKPVNETVKEKLDSKSKLAAWMAGNCGAPSGRDNVVRAVHRELRDMGSSMTLDVYGDCGPFTCARDEMPRCLQIFEKDYFFYFAFENSFAEDYVTEKILHPLQHYAIPVVYGQGNYFRFMPDGIYLDARKLGPAKLARRMIEIASDKELYYSYFKWMNHYSFHYLPEDPDTDFYCQFCAAMHDDKFMGQNTVVKNFTEWWNPPVIRFGPCNGTIRYAFSDIALVCLIIYYCIESFKSLD